MKNKEKTPLAFCPVADKDRCCSLSLYKAVKIEPALRSLTWDTAHLELEVEYNADLDQPEHLEGVLEDLTHHLEERSATCRDREQTRLRKGCGVCVDQLHQKAKSRKTPQGCKSENCTALEVQDLGTLQFKRGIMTARKDPRIQEILDAKVESPWLKKKIKITPSHGSSDSQKEKNSHPLSFWTQLPWEPVFVLLSLGGMVGGLIFESSSPSWISSLLYTLSYITGGYFGLRASIESLRDKKIDIDLLMVLAALGAALVGSPFEGALLLFLFSLSNVLQDFALDKTKSAIKALSKLRPDTALVLETPESSQGRRQPVESITLGTLIQVKPGDRVPLDGTILRGASLVDQSSITGESLPIEKKQGDQVLGGSINQEGEFVLQVTKTSSESTISKVITMVEKAREQQAKTERFLSRFEQTYALVVIFSTVIAAIIPPLLFQISWDVSFYKAITLMVAASPCALIISTPAAILSAIGNGARRGILFKGGVHLEQAAGIQVIAFDKTGTLTEGKPKVTDILPLEESFTLQEVLKIAAALESKSEHVIAQAILKKAKEQNIAFPHPQSFKSQAGQGVRATIENQSYVLGSPALLDQEQFREAQYPRLKQTIKTFQNQGRTVILLAKDDPENFQPLGLISLEDSIRPQSAQVIQDLKAQGIQKIIMLTGDNHITAQKIAQELGVDEVHSQLLPENKLQAIEKIQREYGATAMVGDGVNDAPALAKANLGIAMGAAGSDVALETADVVLLSDDLTKIPYLIALARKTKKTLITNIALALSLILLMIVGIYTIELPLPLAVIGHEGGTVLVSLNGVRLLLFNHKRKEK